eukprot:CAMPEP_0201522982 /NCGR_PEP_ID=MMETSP0161_2-20130828/18673_1 /ASSEMBLY_ACC=CAM_ASM_000251 /TAXON_ID=180227 /ORGANISM="Neoparamoeba aestuarina, Strain SoJaBio B1-5/56/2" /LENGTH=458 /DNA_ID=CAMNT_0047921969 /DNA_START=93 /DNA_END=1469 /DNA_ORIENTATION=+
MSVKKISIASQDGNVASFEMDFSLPVSALNVFCEIEFQIPPDQQEFCLEGKPVSNSSTLDSLGLNESSVLMIRRSQTQQQRIQPHHMLPPSQQPQQPAAPGQGGVITPQFFQQMMQQVMSGQPAQPQQDDPETIRNQLLSDRETLGRIMVANPPLYEALVSGDLERFKTVLESQREAREAAQREHRELQQRIAANPMDIEAQKLIQEQIQRENVNANMQQALEHNPESFGNIIMLYIDCSVNGVPIKVFVDSGAQSTIMSTTCAERCNIMHLIDRRFAGIARGVGTAKILGRVHMADLSIGNSMFTSSFTIMENQSIDMLLGLDMLRRHECCIDLKANVLHIGPEKAPFLPESEIPKDTPFRGSLSGSTDGDIAMLGDLPAESPAPSSSGPPAPHAASSFSNPNPSSTPTPAPAQGASPVSEEVIQNLVNMTGRNRQEVEAVLRACGGNADLAAAQLF